MKKQINIRASNLTRQQLEELTQRWNASKTEAIALLVDRAWQQEIGQQTENKAVALEN